MGIVGMTVIQDLTRAAENMAHKMATGLFNQIKTGGWSRATNIDQAKFQLEGLGVAWDKIVADIEYGVNDTAYGLDSAAKVASQLVASGIQIGDDMKGALRGVSGVAAMTNSSYDEIGAIFTTVAGQGKLMTMQLRQLESRGLNVAANLGKASGELAGKTESEIRDMVTKGKIDFMTFAKAMDEVFGPQAKKANETFEGSLANMKSALSRIGAEFATPIRKNMIPVFNKLREIFNDIKKQKLGQVFKDFNDFSFKMSKVVYGLLDRIHKNLGWVDTLAGGVHSVYQWFDKLMQGTSPVWRFFTKAEEQAEKNKIAEEKRKQKEDLEKTITTCDDFEDHLNEICEKFKNIIGATGVYISKYDLKRKYPIDPDADENGHIDPSNTKVLQYVNWCNDHNFLHHQFLPPGEGVTYKLIGKGEGDEEEGEGENPEEKKEEQKEGEEKKEE